MSKSGLTDVKGNYINGTFATAKNSTDSIKKFSPANLEEAIGEFELSIEDAKSAVSSAAAAYPQWKKTSFSTRLSLLQKYKEVLISRADDLAQTLALEVGKPLWEAKTEIKAMAAKVDITASDGMKVLTEIKIPNILADTHGYCRYKPLGPMVVIGPFNFPGHLPNGHIVPALLCGNTIIFKPSEKTPMTGQLIADCFHEAGFPPGVFNLVQGDAKISQTLTTHPEVRGILFTGSYEVGLAIKFATLEHPNKLLALEMGGKNTAIVWEDANLDNALLETLTGAYMTTGQRCSSTSKIFLHKKVADAFLTRFKKITAGLQIGHPLENPFMGPLIDEAAKNKYLASVELAETEGLDLLLGAKDLEKKHKGYYVTPSLVHARSSSMSNILESRFFQKEIFGPNVVVWEGSDLDEAIHFANATEFGLVASVFTQSEATYLKCWEDLETGLINWNKSTVGASSKLPFGGIKKSGNFWPTAVFAGRYCTHPVTSMEVPTPKETLPNIPGLDWV